MTGLSDREGRAALAGLVSCSTAFLVARGAQAWLGLVPCALCLLERKPYEAGAALAVAALVLPRAAARAVLWLLVAVLAGGAVLSAIHVGVEQRWWPDPVPSCAAPDFAGMTMAQRLAAMPARPAKLCEDADYLIPGVPVSMTQMGLAYAVCASAGIAWLLVRRPRLARFS